MSLLFPTPSTVFQLPPQPPQFPCSPKLQSRENALTQSPAPAPQSHWFPPPLQHLAPPRHPIGQPPHQSSPGLLTSSCSSGDGVGMRERVRTPGSRANEKPLQVPHLSHLGWGLRRSALWTSVRGGLFSVPALRPGPLSSLPSLESPCIPPPRWNQPAGGSWGRAIAWPCPALPTPHHDPPAVAPLAGLPAPLQLL